MRPASWPPPSRGYVAQKHPEGRITFVTLDSGEARTLTGFELGSRVVDWTNHEADTRRKLITFALLAALAAAAVATAGCGDCRRSGLRAASVSAAYGLNGGSRSSTRPPIGSCCCCRAPVRACASITRGRATHPERHASPKGNKLLVLSAGHRAAIGDDEPDEKPSLTVIECRRGVSAQRYELTSLTDPARRPRDRPD